MCEPTTVIMAMTAVASAASAQQQQKLKIQSLENQADAAVQEHNYIQKNIENEAIAEQDRVENELFNQNIEAVKARSSALAASGTSGVTGQTVAAMDQNLSAQIGRQQSDIETNFDIYQQGQQSRSDASYRSLQSTLTGLDQGVSGPGVIDTGLSIASAAYSGYQQDQAFNKKMNEGYVQ